MSWGWSWRRSWQELQRRRRVTEDGAAACCWRHAGLVTPLWGHSRLTVKSTQPLRADVSPRSRFFPWWDLSLLGYRDACLSSRPAAPGWVHCALQHLWSPIGCLSYRTVSVRVSVTGHLPVNNALLTSMFTLRCVGFFSNKTLLYTVISYVEAASVGRRSFSDPLMSTG